MPWVKDSLKISHERGRVRCCEDNFEYFDLTGTGAAPVAPIRARLSLDPEELRRRPTENLDPVLVAEPGNRHDVVDGGRVPRERIIGPDDHVIDPRLGDQVPHALAREHD